MELPTDPSEPDPSIKELDMDQMPPSTTRVRTQSARVEDDEPEFEDEEEITVRMTVAPPPQVNLGSGDESD